MPSPRLRRIALPLVATMTIAALLPTLAPLTTRAADAEKTLTSKVTPGVRTIAVDARGRVAYPADTFQLTISVSSGRASAGQTGARIESYMQHVQEALAQASLPPAEPTSALANIRPLGQGRIYATREFVVKVDSWAAATRAEHALSAMVEGSNTILDHPTLMSATASASSSKLRADPDGARAEAQRKALENARDEARRNAETLGMTLGPPLMVSKLAIAENGAGATSEQSIFVSGEVVFELREK